MRAALFAGLMLTLAPAAAARLPQVGQPAPDFRITLMDGRHVALAELKGQVVVLNFWATWCLPCKRELPLLDAYYARVADHGLKVFAVTTEDSLLPSQLKPLAKILSIPLVKGIHGSYAPMGGVPTNYVIDRQGVLRYAKAGAFQLDDLNAILVPLLNEPAPVPAITAAR